MDMKDLEFRENSSDELLKGIIEYYDLINSYGDNASNILLDDTQKNLNIFLNKRLKEIYEYDFMKKTFLRKIYGKEMNL